MWSPVCASSAMPLTSSARPYAAVYAAPMAGPEDSTSTHRSCRTDSRSIDIYDDVGVAVAVGSGPDEAADQGGGTDTGSYRDKQRVAPWRRLPCRELRPGRGADVVVHGDRSTVGLKMPPLLLRSPALDSASRGSDEFAPDAAGTNGAVGEGYLSQRHDLGTRTAAGGAVSTADWSPRMPESSGGSYRLLQEGQAEAPVATVSRTLRCRYACPAWPKTCIRSATSSCMACLAARSKGAGSTVSASSARNVRAAAM